MARPFIQFWLLLFFLGCTGQGRLIGQVETIRSCTKNKTPKPMQAFISTLCTSLLLALASTAAAQPTPAIIPPSDKGQERTIPSIPLPPMPGEEPHTTYCPMKIGKIPHRDKPLKVDYSRKPGAGRVPSGEQIIREECVPEIVDCHDTETYSALSASGSPPLPPPPPRIVCSDLFRVIEEMPRFPGCEELTSPEEKRQCSGEKLLEFLYQNLTYPPLARENCVEGTVVIQFVVEKDGTVTNATIVRDIGAHCGEAALDAVNLMNEQGLKWIPGRQRGRVVRVQFNLPVKFRIDCPDTEPIPVAETPAPGPASQKEKKEQADEALPPSEATPSGTPLTFEPEGFRLFPNPAAEWLNIRCQPTPGRVSLAIVNTVGQVLWMKEYAHTDGILEERANLTPWPPGPYFLHIEQGGAVQTHTFIRQR